MSARPPIPLELHRLRYAAGQELRSDDLRDGLAIEAQLRWWHNRAKHDAVGVAAGLNVTVVELTPGVAVLAVEPGVAYDGFGRELLVCARRVVRPPEGVAEGEAVVLLLRAPAEREGRAASAACAPGGSATRAACVGPEATLCWSRALPDACAAIPIARLRRAEDSGWTVEPPPWGSRAVARPRIGRGATIRGSTPWDVWATAGDEIFLGVEATLDTSAAGFRTTPHYFAHFAGEAAPSDLLDDLGATAPELLVPLLHVTDAAPDRFKVRVFFPLGFAPAEFRAGFASVYRRDVALCWLGIESPRDSRCRKDVR